MLKKPDFSFFMETSQESVASRKIVDALDKVVLASKM